MNRCIVLFLLSSIGWIFSPQKSLGAPARPNFLLILTDDHGYGDVSTYHPSDAQTPHIDRLATEGMLFTRMRANCTVCSPTRAALLTGRYPDRVGVPGVIRTMPADSWAGSIPGCPRGRITCARPATTPRSLANGTWASNHQTSRTNAASTTSTVSSVT